MNKIAIVGCGQIGSRHLQALGKIDLPVEICVLDSSPESLKTAELRFNETQTPKNPNILKISYLTSWQDLPSKLDVAIFAMTADRRREAMERVFEKSEVRYVILEKVVFQREKDFEWASETLKKNKTQGWVNCPSRLFPGYKFIRDLKLKAIHFSVIGSNWGLACNSVHYLDTFSFLTAEKLTSVESLLDSGSIPSKRSNFIEVSGTLAAMAGPNRAFVTCLRKGDLPTSIHISCESHDFIIYQDLQKMWTRSAETKWDLKESEFPILYQSQLSHIIVRELLTSGHCALPTFSESWQTHSFILKTISQHLSNGAKGEIHCSIT